MGSNAQQQQQAAIEVVRTHRPKLRSTKSLCQAENMRFIHEESPSKSGLSQLDPVEEYKRELSENFCLPESRMEMDYRLVENEGLFQEYLEMGELPLCLGAIDLVRT